MAEKRMFTKKIIDSDAFLDMPLSTQALYFHLSMRADDDGFINNPKRIQRTVGASDDDLKLLIAKRFVICFENGVIVIKHWWMHNTLRKDRYNPTTYQDELAMLKIKDNKAYTEKDGNQLATTWQPNGNQLVTQYSIDKYSIDKNNNILPSSDEPETPTQKKTKPVKHKYGEYKHVLLTENEYNNLSNEFGADVRDKAIKFLDEYIEEKGYKSKSHNLAIRRWVIDAVSKQGKTNSKKSKFNDFKQNDYDFEAIENDLLNNDEFEQQKQELQNKLKEKYGQGG